MKPLILSIGFDGPNRSGKGTHANLLKQLFASNGIPSIVIRGDGTRPASGLDIGDPSSKRWDEKNPQLKGPNSTPLLREEAANRLGRELIVYKSKILPSLIEKHKSELGILLIDRSLISRTIIPIQYNLNDIFYGNYQGKGRKISIEDVKPDLLFFLDTGRNTLLNRLFKNDPKYSFRKNLIEINSQNYIKNIKYIPFKYQNIIRTIDGDQSIEDIHSKIKEQIYNYTQDVHGIDLSFLK